MTLEKVYTRGIGLCEGSLLGCRMWRMRAFCSNEGKLWVMSN